MSFQNTSIIALDGERTRHELFSDVALVLLACQGPAGLVTNRKKHSSFNYLGAYVTHDLMESTALVVGRWSCGKIVRLLVRLMPASPILTLLIALLSS